MYPKTIRLPEVSTTLIPVYSTEPPKHPPARTLLGDLCPASCIN